MLFINILKKIKHYLYLPLRQTRRFYSRVKRNSGKYAAELFPVIAAHLKHRRLAKIIQDAYGCDVLGSTEGKVIAVIARDGSSYPKSSVFIRLISPLVTLVDQKKVSLSLYNENTTSLAIGTDIVIVQRTAYDSKKTAQALIKYTRENKIPIIVDNDDAFHAIDHSHPEYQIQKQRSDATDLLKEAAHEVWFSTDKLSNAYSKLGNKRKVMRNTIDRRMWSTLGQPAKLPEEGSPLQIIYMGTATHGADFSLVLHALEAIAKSNPDSFRLTIIGVSKDVPDYPWINRLYQPRNGSIYPRFINWFIKQGPFDIGLAPLVDSEFNRGKSDIKCLDYLACGITPIVSDTVAYQAEDIQPYIVRVKNTDEEWLAALLDQVKNKEKNRRKRIKNIALAHEYIRTNRSTDILAQEMHKRLIKLLGSK